MTIELFAHPFSSYCQKVLVALYENGTPFTYRHLGEAGVMAELEALWPLKKFPVLRDRDRTVVEASIIIEHLDAHHPGAHPLIPRDVDAALDVRFMDRFFDNYVHAPMQLIVGDALLEGGQRNPHGVATARARLDAAYRWLDARMAGRDWSAGAFSLADCAAAPALFYADWAHPIGDAHRHVRAYRDRLNARPSFARAIEEARPDRHLFPLGAPDRD